MSALSEGFKQGQIPDMERRLASMIRLGTVAALDEQNARIRVKAGDITTGWLPWAVGRAGPDRTWAAPEIGEQVIMASPSGDLAQAVVIGTIYQDNHPAPANSKDVTRTEWSDGASEEYNRETHTHTLDIPAGGTIVLKIGSTTLTMQAGSATLHSPSVTIDSPNTHFTGNVTSDGDVVASGISLVHHKHTGVTPGPSLTGLPV